VNEGSGTAYPDSYLHWRLGVRVLGLAGVIQVRLEPKQRTPLRHHLVRDGSAAPDLNRFRFETDEIGGQFGIRPTTVRAPATPLTSGSGDQRQNAMLMILLARSCTIHHGIARCSALMCRKALSFRASLIKLSPIRVHLGFVFDLLQPYLASVELHLGAPYHALLRAVTTHDRPDNLSLSHP
jgi:hypothetical protein